MRDVNFDILKVSYTMRLLFLMFVTAVCVLLILKLRWPKTKSIYDNLLVSLTFCCRCLSIWRCSWFQYCLSCQVPVQTDLSVISFIHSFIFPVYLDCNSGYSGTPLILSPIGQKNLVVLTRLFFYKKMYGRFAG